MAYFQTPEAIVTQMLADHLELTTQAGSPVDLKVTDIDRPEVIKYLTDASAISQWTATLDQVADDVFPGSATEPGLEKHLAQRQMPPRIVAQPSSVQIQRTGAARESVGVDDQMLRVSDGTYWELQATITLDDTGQAVGTYQSVLDGQALDSDTTGDAFTAVTPTAGVSSNGASTSPAQNGRDLETPAEMLARIIAHDQNPDNGGNLAAYETLALDASDQVVTASAVKTNPDEVTTYITAGTTNIETALRNGNAVERIPSDGLIAIVLAAIQASNPTTDTALVAAPSESFFNLTFNYELYDETQRTVVDAEVQILIKLFIYQAQGNTNYSPTDLERLIQGRIGFLMSRMRAANFSGSEFGFMVPANTLLKPGTITTGTLT